MGAFEFGLTASSDQVNLVFGDLVSGANNDCPDPSAPSGVVSVTISGTQMGQAGLITLCVPRPDQLNGTVPLGTAVKIVDLNATDPSCTYAIDRSQLPTGTVKGEGVCDNGTNAAGFALVFDGFVGLRRTCGVNVDSVSVGLTGTVAVKPM